MSTGSASPSTAEELSFFGDNTAPRPAAAGANQPYFPMWWKFTAPATGRVTIDSFATTGEDADTMLEVYRSLADIPSSDYYRQNDDFDGRLSKVMFGVVEGEVFYVKVGCYANSWGLAEVYGLNVSMIVPSGTWVTLRPQGTPVISDATASGGSQGVVGTSAWGDQSDATYTKTIWRYNDAWNGLAWASFGTVLDNVYGGDSTIKVRIKGDPGNLASEYFVQFALGVDHPILNWNTNNLILGYDTPTTLEMPLYGTADYPGGFNREFIEYADSAIAAGLASGNLGVQVRWSPNYPLVPGVAFYYYVYDVEYRVQLGAPYTPQLQITGQLDKTRVRFL